MRAKEIAGHARVETRKKDVEGGRGEEWGRARNSFSIRVLFVRKMEFHEKRCRHIYIHTYIYMCTRTHTMRIRLANYIRLILAQLLANSWLKLLANSRDNNVRAYTPSLRDEFVLNFRMKCLSMILKYVISANYRTILSFELYRDTQIRGGLTFTLLYIFPCTRKIHRTEMKAALFRNGTIKDTLYFNVKH